LISAFRASYGIVPLMQAKETVRSVLESLPDDCSLDDVLYHLYGIQMIERGKAYADAGRLIPHEVVAEEMRLKWQVGREA
jgi:hypothetical protein